MPGFTVGLVLVVLIVRGNADGNPSGGDIGWNDVPQVFRDYVDGKVVEIVLLIASNRDMAHVGDEDAFRAQVVGLLGATRTWST